MGMKRIVALLHIATTASKGMDHRIRGSNQSYVIKRLRHSPLPSTTNLSPLTTLQRSTLFHNLEKIPSNRCKNSQLQNISPEGCKKNAYVIDCSFLKQNWPS